MSSSRAHGHYVAWPGASPQDVEEQIIVRMEEALSEVQGVNRMWAFAGEGGGLSPSSERTASMKPSDGGCQTRRGFHQCFPARRRRAADKCVSQPRRNHSAGRLRRRERVGAGAETLCGENSPRSGLARLCSVRGLFGVRDEEVSIEVSEDALRQYGLTLGEVAQAVRGTSVNASSGTVRTDIGNMQLRTRNQADSQAEFENIVVRQDAGGALIRVNDVATVIDGFEQVNLLATVNGKRTVLVQAMSGPSMDIVKMSNNVTDYLERTADSLPEGFPSRHGKMPQSNIRGELRRLRRTSSQGFSWFA